MTWVVIIKDYYNDCGVGGFEDAVGPFKTEKEARERAKAINALRCHATLAEAYPLAERYYAEESS